MRVHLLFPDRDAVRDQPPAPGADDLVADLDLEPVLTVMLPDRHLEQLCPSVLLNPLTDPGQIRWRQQILADVLADPSGMQRLFELAGRALESQRGAWLWSGRTADSALARAVHGLGALLPFLTELAALAGEQLAVVHAPGLRQLHRRLVDDLDPDYLHRIRSLLGQLAFPAGLTTRATIGTNGLLGDFEVLPPPAGRRPWWALLGFNPRGRLQFTLGERDESGARALGALHADVLHEIAAVAAQANEHVLGFFRQLRWETGFYVGCRQLHDRLRSAGVGVCWPGALVPRTGAERLGAEVETDGLVPLNLAVRSGRVPVGNDLAGTIPLLVITGANQGGKTTFLRSLGLAQLLLQAGMFVPAAHFRASLAGAVHTHFRRGEDDDLRSGKLDEELTRMSAIVDRVRPGDLVLMNESFAATDEVEGSWIAADIIDALLAHGVRVLLVTHFHALARHYEGRPGTCFLRAERLPDGSRSHRLVPGVPQPTSHGMDLFDQLFVRS